MRVLIQVEVVAPEGATHFSGSIEDPIWWRSNNPDQLYGTWDYYHSRRHVWTFAGFSPRGSVKPIIKVLG